MRLTDQHHLFVRHYAATGNPRAAYIAAGYSEKFARQNAAKLLKHPDIRKMIDQLQAIDRTRTSHQMIVAGAAKGAAVHAQLEDGIEGLGQTLNRIATIRDLQLLARITMGLEPIKMKVLDKKTGQVAEVEVTVTDFPTAHKSLVTILAENDRLDKLRGGPRGGDSAHNADVETLGKKLGDLLDSEREAARRRLAGY